MTDMKITVFTPTYNRAHLLRRLFESLIKQTVYGFEWLVVDDESTDNTKTYGITIAALDMIRLRVLLVVSSLYSAKTYDNGIDAAKRNTSI